MRRPGERGAVAILVAVVLVVLVGFVALVVDVGQLFRARNELQNAGDSAALAGAAQLDRTPAGLARARAAAHDYGVRHQAIQSDVALRAEDIVLGAWDDDAEVFTPLPDTLAPAINAVRVTARRDTLAGGPVDLFFAPVIGRSVAPVRADAVAISGGPKGECAFPMVVPDCALDTPVADGTCGFCLTYQDNNTDNAGWTAFDESSVGATTITDLIARSCLASDGSVAIDPATAQCTGGCAASHVDDEVKVNNGNMMNSGAQNFCPLIQTLLTRGVVGGTPQPFVVYVPVLRSTSTTCDAAQFSSYHTIAGYATMEILGAKCGNADPGVIVPSPPCPPPSSGKFIVARLRCDLTSEEVAGGGYFGVRAAHVRLVR